MDQCKMVMQIAVGDTIDQASPARIIKVQRAGPHSSFLVDCLIPFDVDPQSGPCHVRWLKANFSSCVERLGEICVVLP